MSYPTETISGRYWRIMSPRWAHDPLSGEGAARNGGRWNRPGMEALYLAESVETAFAEYQQEVGTRPGTFAAYGVVGANIVDLSRKDVQAALGVSEAEMLAPWKQLAFVERRDPPSWRLFDRLQDGVHGARTPSAQRDGAYNLVLWRWNIPGAPAVSVLDPHGDLESRRS